MFALAMLASLLFTIPTGADAGEVLRALAMRMGGDGWTRVGAVIAVGRKTSFGLSGRYREADDLRTGLFRRDADYGLFANAEGTDPAGRWRQDGSGGVHPLDSNEALAIARTERYLARRGYLRAETGTRRRLLAPAADARTAYVRVEVTPAAGRPATLWIRRSDALLERVTIALSPHVEQMRYSDYRRVGPLLLPFRLAVEHGDEAESGVTTIASYRLLSRLSPTTFERPHMRDDVTFPRGGTITTVPARIDRASGFLLVDASLDGGEPSPFIIDTGGHDIVTVAEARRLRLPLVGGGKSYGAGSGSTPTRFTRVRSVALGAARLGPQPFTVLALDLGTTRGAMGRNVPVAGILGLEIFERFSVAVTAERVSFQRGTRGNGDARCRAVALRFTNDMPLARASVDGESGVFGIDTGNNGDPILFSSWLVAKGLSGLAPAGSATAGMSVGGSMAMTHGAVARLRLGPSVFPALPVAISRMRTGSLSTVSEAGNLGLSVLARFARVQFEYARGRMCLEPHA